MVMGVGKFISQLREPINPSLDSGGVPRPKERSPDGTLGSRGEGA